MRTYVIGEDRIFLFGQRRTEDSDLEFENATYTIFNQPKSNVAEALQVEDIW